MTARIKREVTRNGDEVRYVHSFCTDCPYWHAFEWTLQKAYEAGERHLINVHDIDPREASSARRQHEVATGRKGDTPT